MVLEVPPQCLQSLDTICISVGKRRGFRLFCSRQVAVCEIDDDHSWVFIGSFESAPPSSAVGAESITMILLGAGYLCKRGGRIEVSHLGISSNIDWKLRNVRPHWSFGRRCFEGEVYFFSQVCCGEGGARNVIQLHSASTVPHPKVLPLLLKSRKSS